MLRLAGIPVSDSDVDWLIDVLNESRSQPCRATANTLTKAVVNAQEIVVLTTRM